MKSEASPVLVVAALAERRGPGGLRELFLARRSASAGCGGLWELPGGKVEPGEEPGAALLRELAEELGVGARILGEPRRYEAPVGGKRFVFLVFPAELAGEPRRLAAHDEWHYVPAAELSAYALAPLDGPALADWAAREAGA